MYTTTNGTRIVDISRQLSIFGDIYIFLVYFHHAFQITSQIDI
jgi:hypothetical protein